MSDNRSNSAFVRHVWPLLQRRRWALTGAMLLVGVHGVALALQNAYPKWFFSQVLEPAGLTMHDRWIRLLWLVAGYLVVSNILRMACWHAGYRLFTWAREKVIYDLRGQFFRHVNLLCLRFHGQHSSGELFSYLFGSPLQNIMQFFQHTSMSVPGAIVSIVCTLGLFWTWDWVIASMLMTTSLASVYMMIRSREKMQTINREFQDTEGNVSGHVADLLRGNKAVKLYAMEERVARHFSEQASLIGRMSYQRDVRSHLEYMKQESFGYVCYVLLLAACTWRYLGGHIDLGVVAACLTSFAGLNWPMQALFTAFSMWGSADASFERLGAVLDTSSSTPDPESGILPVPRNAEISLERVIFAYEPERIILNEVSLRIPVGQRVALVGPSGAGKSTIAQLLLRLYDPQSGSVCIGGTDLRRFESAELRRHFGVVPQDPFIFRTTLRENLRVSKSDATDVEIRRACELANAWEFIQALPEGLDSKVGEGGSTLSGGQRQRLAIARALLADPEVFILDEATSALDTLSEKLIQEALERNLGGRTVIFIAHRLATVRNCDRILVVNEGRIQEDGRYDELIARGGLFSELVRGQSLRT